MTFDISGNTYLARDPAVYGTDVIVRETRKKRFNVEHPEARQLPRETYRANFLAWCGEIEDSIIEAQITLSAFLIPQDGAPEITDELIASSTSFGIDEALNFFSTERTIAWSRYLLSKTNGTATETTIPTTDPTSESTSLPSTKSD